MLGCGQTLPSTERISPLPDVSHVSANFGDHALLVGGKPAPGQIISYLYTAFGEVEVEKFQGETYGMLVIPPYQILQAPNLSVLQPLEIPIHSLIRLIHQ